MKKTYDYAADSEPSPTDRNSQFTDSYIYSLDNRHIYRKNVRQSDDDTTEEVTFRMPDGKAIGTYRLCVDYYQGHKLFFCMGGGGMYTGDLRLMADRIGSYIGDSHFPYGEKAAGGFATYGKHPSGLYHADQRYYSATHGRFLTADPYVASAGPEDPASWNRYSYVGGDPINRNDPKGLFWDDFPRLMQDFISTGGGGGLPCMYDPLGWRPFGSSWYCLAPIMFMPPPQNEESELPECDVQLRYRPVRSAASLANHAYLQVTTTSGGSLPFASYGPIFVIEGQPEFNPPKLEQVPGVLPEDPPGVLLDWGKLQMSASRNGNGNDLSKDATWGRGVKGTWVCDSVARILGAVGIYMTSPVDYFPSGPNSNSTVSYLLRAGGLSSNFTQPPRTPGWSVVIRP